MDDVQYTDGPHGTLAYLVWGHGPDLVTVTNWATNIEAITSTPETFDWFDRLAESFRLVMYDQRGTGLSQRGSITHDLDAWVDDMVTVFDAAGVTDPVLFATDFSAPVAVAFAARHPGRVRGLVLYGGFARLLDRDGSGVGLPMAMRQASVDMVVQGWGHGDSLFARLGTPGEHQQAEREAVARVQRLALNPNEVRSLVPIMFDVDVTDLLPSVDVPVLVLHRVDDALVPSDHAHHLATRLPRAELVALPGDDHYMFLGDADRVIEEVEAFAGLPPATRTARGELAAVWFSDIVASTATAGSVGARAWARRLDEHDTLVEHHLRRHGGVLVKHLGDGVLATFGSAAAAVRCARRFSERSRAAGLPVRVGIHAGEIQRRADGDITGLAVHVAQRVQTQAEPSEVLVTATVRDAVLGSDLRFARKGEYHLKGIDEPVTLYVAEG